MRKVLAILGSIVVGFLVITAFELLAGIIFPLPETIDTSSIDSIQNNIHLVPVGALVTIIFAHAAGVFSAVFVVSRFWKNVNAASFVGILIVLSAILNLLFIPHPIWFAYADIIAIVLAFLVAVHIFIRKYQTD